MAQIREIHEALEKVTRPSNGWNKSLLALIKVEHAARKATAAAALESGRIESRKSPAAKNAGLRSEERTALR